MLKKRDYRKTLRTAIQGLPLVAILYASTLSEERLPRQFLILMVLLWVQVYFMSEFLLANRWK